MKAQDCYISLKKDELKKLCTSLKITIKSSFSKAELAKVLDKEDVKSVVQKMTSIQLSTILKSQNLTSTGKVSEKRTDLFPP
jgi:hypothetical protein